jgi:hypothetical protein
LNITGPTDLLAILHTTNLPDHKSITETIVHTIYRLMNGTISYIGNSTGPKSFAEFQNLNKIELAGHRSFAELHTLNRTEAFTNPMARAIAQIETVTNYTVSTERATDPTVGEKVKEYGRVLMAIILIVVLVNWIYFSFFFDKKKMLTGSTWKKIKLVKESKKGDTVKPLYKNPLDKNTPPIRI